MNKDKRYYNQFDNFLFMLSVASVDWSFGLNEIPEKCINSNFSNSKYIEKPVSEKSPKKTQRSPNDT